MKRLQARAEAAASGAPPGGTPGSSPAPSSPPQSQQPALKLPGSSPAAQQRPERPTSHQGSPAPGEHGFREGSEAAPGQHAALDTAASINELPEQASVLVRGNAALTALNRRLPCQATNSFLLVPPAFKVFF